MVPVGCLHLQCICPGTPLLACHIFSTCRVAKCSPPCKFATIVAATNRFDKCKPNSIDIDSLIWYDWSELLQPISTIQPFQESPGPIHQLTHDHLISSVSSGNPLRPCQMRPICMPHKGRWTSQTGSGSPRPPRKYVPSLAST